MALPFFDRRLFKVILTAVFVVHVAACRQDVEISLSEDITTGHAEYNSQYWGFYLLNEGNMGSNKSTLDYYDFATGIYKKNIYSERNPTVPKQLGDVGNDIGIYGSKLYAVINVSNKVEVMDALSTKKIGQINIPNCRYIDFHEQYAYVTSYAGPVRIDPNYTQQGFVAKIDTASLQEVSRCLVGFQPDELAIVGNKIYVANSGGYMGGGSTDRYERTVSVIDITTFREEARIDVAYNLSRIKADKYGNLWVSSRGDYKSIPSRLYCISSQTHQVIDSIPIPVSNYWIDDHLLYAYATEWSNTSFSSKVSYHVVDVNTRKVISQRIITDGTDTQIEVPYGIMVNPVNKDVYITDAGNYVTPGVLYCFDRYGRKKWELETGNIPAHFVLVSK